ATCRGGSAVSTASRLPRCPDPTSKPQESSRPLPRASVDRDAREQARAPLRTETVMTDATTQIANLSRTLPGRVSTPGEDRYAAAIATWAQVDVAPTAAVTCRSAADVQAAIAAARKANLPLSVRGGGDDWVGRALCDGMVIDLSEMREV